MDAKSHSSEGCSTNYKYILSTARGSRLPGIATKGVFSALETAGYNFPPVANARVHVESDSSVLRASVAGILNGPAKVRQKQEAGSQSIL